MAFENKAKFPLWVYPQTIENVRTHYRHDNCKSQSEFIEKAISFYIGYLDEERSVNYISPMITETVKATIAGTEQRLSRLLFKVAVELGKISNMLAAVHDIEGAHQSCQKDGDRQGKEGGDEVPHHDSGQVLGE